MDVVVTGTSGLVGRYLLEQLLHHGHTATGVDRVRPEHDVAPYRIVDLEDLVQVYDVFMGAERPSFTWLPCTWDCKVARSSFAPTW